MSVDSNKVRFYQSKNCTGNSFEYSAGESVLFHYGDKWNDTFLSCIVGSNVWVNAYQHNDEDQPGIHEVWKSGTHNDLSSIDGLSKFQVLQNEFGYAIDIKLLLGPNVAKKDAGAFKLTLIPFKVSPLSVLNGDDYHPCPIPQLTPPTSEIVCQLTVAETAWPGATVANGSIYFSYDPSKGKLSFRKSDGFPTNMDVEQTGFTNFDFKLLSTP